MRGEIVIVWSWRVGVFDWRNVLCVCLSAILLSGCGSIWPFVVPTATPTTVPPTASALPSSTPVPPTATFTPVFTRTPTPADWVPASEATATWTPVPGNPRWSVWSYRNLVFLLPVAWQNVPTDADTERVFRAPGGSEQPRLRMRVATLPPETASGDFSQNDLAAASQEFSAFEVIESSTAEVAGNQAERYVFIATIAESGRGEARHVQGVVYYWTVAADVVILQFTVNADAFDEWVGTFDDIVAGVEVRR